MPGSVGCLVLCLNFWFLALEAQFLGLMASFCLRLPYFHRTRFVWLWHGFPISISVSIHSVHILLAFNDGLHAVVPLLKHGNWLSQFLKQLCEDGMNARVCEEDWPCFSNLSTTDNRFRSSLGIPYGSKFIFPG